MNKNEAVMQRERERERERGRERDSYLKDFAVLLSC